MVVQESQIRVKRPAANLSVYFRENGSTWIVFVNGHTRPGSDFRAFMRVLQENGFSSMTLDNRGAGDTEYAGGFTLQDMVEDILEGMAALNIERAHFLGISMGGVLIQHVAARAPDMVRSLALVSTTCRDHYLNLDEKPWGNDLKSVHDKMRPYFSESYYARNKVLIDAMCKQILKDSGNGKFSQRASDQRNAIDSYDTTKFLREINCPVKIFHGAKDEIISVEVVDDFLQFIPHAEASIYEGVGHLLLAECPKDLYNDYLDFLRNIGN